MAFRHVEPGIPARQRAAEQAARDADKDAWRETTQSIDWKRSDRFWREQDGTVVAFDTLPDKRIWEIVIWMVNAHLSLAKAWATKMEACFGPSGWLAQQPMFKALVIEAANRGLSFPPSTFSYIRDRLDVTSGEAPQREAEPWRNEKLRAVQQEAMNRIAGIEPDPYEKQRRNISFEE